MKAKTWYWIIGVAAVAGVGYWMWKKNKPATVTE